MAVASTLLPKESKASAKKMPALFFSHGSPMNIILDNDFTKMLKKTAADIPTPAAILVISAHWVDDGNLLSSTDKTETIYDFGGFPDALYEVSYPSKGSPFLADKLKLPTTNRGLDHGAWSILHHLYPDANIPTMQLSINKNLSLQEHFTLGKSLDILRDYAVLIIGSGGVTHNLRYFDFEHLHPTPEASAKKFDNYVKNVIEKRDYKMLLNPSLSGVDMPIVHPTLEHYIPLLYIAGLASKDEESTFLHEGFQNKAFSMRSWKVG